jgi:cytochrome c5
VGSTQDEDEGHSSAIKTPGQLIAVLLAAFVLPVVILLMIGRLAVITNSNNQDSSAFSAEAVAKRLEPVGRLVIAGDSSATQEEKPAQIASAPAPASAPGVAVSDTGNPADKAKGIYAASCAACHTTGAAGAPKLGDAAAWAPRIKAGREALYNSALKGKNAMPPKGGNASLSDEEVKAVVDYMVSQSK